MDALILRLDAPLLSFGAVMVDQHGVVDRFPGTAMLTGLLGNALGWDHRDAGNLQALQERLAYAARWDVSPEELVDYHTVDLSQFQLREPGWTTRGRPEHRLGGPAARTGTHQRRRHYWTDGLMTIALAVTEDTSPSLLDLQSALRSPARPIFLGRKTCLPARPLVDISDPIASGENLRSILANVPVWNRHGQVTLNPGRMMACWPPSSSTHRGEVRRVYDLRDWHNQLPVGSHLRVEGTMGEE